MVVARMRSVVVGLFVVGFAVVVTWAVLAVGMGLVGARTTVPTVWTGQ